MIKFFTQRAFLLVLALFSITTWANNAANQKTLSITPHFASLSEAQTYISTRDNFTASLNQSNLDLRLGKSGATFQELINLMKGECREFTDAEKEKVSTAFRQILDTMNANGFVNLKVPDEIVFVKTTMKEELDAGGYTRNGIIYLGEQAMDNDARLKYVVAHEFFHVLTHEFKDFRSAVYPVIGFKVSSSLKSFKTDIKNRIICNPDACTYDSFATFTIKGKKYPCVLVPLLDDTYKTGDNIFKHMLTCLVPLKKHGDFYVPMTKHGKTVFYTKDQTSDFDDVMGQNTSYAIDPEECLAENFTMTILKGVRQVRTPQIIEKIKQLLSGK